jgi:hypothetical protein
LELNVFPTPKSLFAQIPEKERTFLLHLLHAANEINILIKLFSYTARGEEEGLLAYATMVQSMTLGRLLTGKLSDASSLIHKAYVKTGLDKLYATDLGPEATDSVDRLMDYFANRSNLITTIRDGFSSHYDSERLSKHFDTAPESERWEVVLANHNANNLYLAPEIVLLHAMMSEIHTGDHDEAFQKLMDDTSRVSSWFQTFASGVLKVALERHLGGFGQWDANREVLQITNAPSFHTLRIPFFTEVESKEPL